VSRGIRPLIRRKFRFCVRSQTRPHVRLGEVRAEPSSQSVDVTKIEEALRKEAAKLGADAVVVVYDRTQVRGAVVTGPW